MNLADPHDVDNTYSWTTGTTDPTGTAFTNFLPRLNNCTSSNGISFTNGGFAGHCDWRLPTIQELKSIVDLAAAGCGAGNACIDASFAVTAPQRYYSITTDSNLASLAWYVFFVNGNAASGGAKTNAHYVRAVRTL